TLSPSSGSVAAGSGTRTLPTSTATLSSAVSASNQSATLTLTVNDGQGTSTCNTTVTFNDNASPTITLVGSNPLTVECHGPFSDPGATASDACAGTLTGAIVASGSVDANTVGSYTRSYTVSDGQGHSDTKTRTVNVVDTQPPSLTLVGADPLTVECH